MDDPTSELLVKAGELPPVAPFGKDETMPHVEAHQPGMFCWVELATTDRSAAKQFYEKLFGWTSRDIPMGEGEPYTIFQLDGRDVGAVYSMMPDQRAAGIPPNWMNYVAVLNTDEAATKAASLGATVMSPPMDVFDQGRFAVIQDPTGAVFAVWQPMKHHGMGVTNEDNAWCWAELVTSDQAKATTFYTSLFGWTTYTMPMGTNPNEQYVIGKVGAADAAGIMAMQPGMEGIPPHWTPYFAIANCDDTANQAKAAGATVYVPPTDIPTIGRFSVLGDPTGATFAIIQAAPRA